ncbi:hypothetical protein SAICODRAFT_117164 [Saitoella complicata NRRL Y-17804]|uniref:uncharacterized protein n=1 Tax=Saitoella complicata (strain BCRC 22490 / CBS 7301 / JCM 7358 / NBRC 10748 / NRRL Y-17804) TaxID=698492 RepID=UPI0008677D7E|nr:uncharacterized protein SAICODRAFT_117164 [Saitoella complicata NRRL Y-17804]ODQ53124.1 hypothetical protein SAICODRAFT_117164 [Saitoella complicata NRRL Y-17804]
MDLSEECAHGGLVLLVPVCHFRHLTGSPRDLLAASVILVDRMTTGFNVIYPCTHMITTYRTLVLAVCHDPTLIHAHWRNRWADEPIFSPILLAGAILRVSKRGSLPLAKPHSRVTNVVFELPLYFDDAHLPSLCPPGVGFSTAARKAGNLDGMNVVGRDAETA